MNLLHLRAFHHVATHLSFSRAAEELNVSQPNVSMQVRRLEDTLGISLVEVVGRHLSLTEAGTVLSAYAQRIFRLEAQAEEAIAGFRDLRQGHLRIGASTTPGAYILPALLAAYQGRYRGVELQLEMGNSRQVAQRLAALDLDLAVIGSEAAGAHPDLEAEPLCRDCLVAVAGPGHPLMTSGAVDAETLVRQRLLVREPGSSTREVLAERLREHHLTLTPAMELGSNEALKQAAAAGLGLAILSRFAVAWELQSGLLVEIPLTGFSLERTFYLAWHRERRLSGPAAAFAALLRAADLPQKCHQGG